MSTASVTYNFVNGTTASANEVNQNNQDIVDFLNESVVHVDGSQSLTGNLDMGSNRITGLSAPVANTDAASKVYADALNPGGLIALWPSTSIPTGWALCDGTQYVTASYPATAAALGAVGVNFNVPDLRGRFAVGKGTSPLDTLLGTGGSRDATNISHSHTVTGTAASNGVGYELVRRYASYGTADYGVPYDPDSDGLVLATQGTGSGSTGFGSTMAVDVGDTGAHTHSVSGSTSTDGSSGTNANLPPYMVLNFIIRML